MKLCRSKEDPRLAGMCCGPSAGLGWSPVNSRLVSVLMGFFTGGGSILADLVLCYLLPKAPAPAQIFEPAVLQPWKKSA